MEEEPAFTIFPAIDLRGGRVVRLAQGDPGRQTSYGDEPRLWAERWKSEGATWLHVVNLDGAFGEDARANLQALQAIQTTGLKVEFGGGMRDRDSIRQALELGVERVFLGTAAVLDPALLDWAIGEYGPARIAADIGARDGRVTIRGWQEETALTVLEAGMNLRDHGINWCVLTDVRRDGVSAGLDLAEAVELQSATKMNVVASGGVNSTADVDAARKAGLSGVIIGRALYEDHLTLADCWRQG